MNFLNRTSSAALVASALLALSASVQAQSTGATSAAPYGSTSGSSATGGTSGGTSGTSSGAAGAPAATTYGNSSASPAGSTSGTGADASTYGTGSSDSAGSSSGTSSGTYSESNSSPMAYDAPAAGQRTDDSSYSWLPYTTRGYVGVNAGRAELDDLPCSPFYSCDDSTNRAVKVYTGGMFNDYFGLELGYFNTGSFDRSGGRVRAQGASLSFLAQAPLGTMAAVYAKLGGTYAWTKTSAGALAVGTPTGDESGAGVAYGVGLRINATRNWAVVVEWDQKELKFAGDDKQNTRLTTVGVQYRF